MPRDGDVSRAMERRPRRPVHRATAARGDAPRPTVLVTGGGGFLGSALVRRLRADGVAVRSLGRRQYPHLASLGVDQLRGDVGDKAAVMDAVAGVGAVFHVAAKTGISGAWSGYEWTNVRGTQNILAACRAHGVAQLIYTSSPSVVFGGEALEGVDESTPYPHRYLAAYPATKAAAERAVLAADTPSMATVALRPHLIWGPGDRHLLPRILARARSGRLHVLGDGENRIDAVYIDNVVDAHVLAWRALATQTGAVSGRAYFITNQEPWTMAAFLAGLLEAAGLSPVISRIPRRFGYLLAEVLETAHRLGFGRGEPLLTRFVARQLATAHWFDGTRSKQDLNYTARVSMHEGMQRLKAHLQAGAHAGPENTNLPH